MAIDEPWPANNGWCGGWWLVVVDGNAFEFEEVVE